MRRQKTVRSRTSRVLLPVVAATAWLAFGCGDSEGLQESGSTGERAESKASNSLGEATFEAKIDGELIDFSGRARADYVAQMNMLSLSGRNFEIIIMRIDLDALDLPATLGREEYETTTISDMDQLSLVTMGYTDEDGKEWGGMNVELTIEAIDGQRIRGSFSGTLYEDGGEDERIDLSEGRFDFKLVE